MPGFQAGIGLNHRRRREKEQDFPFSPFYFSLPPFFSFYNLRKPMTDKVSDNDVARATHSPTVETQQPPAPTRGDGTLRTRNDGELNPPTGATSSTTISSDQLKQLLSTVTELGQ